MRTVNAISIVVEINEISEDNFMSIVKKNNLNFTIVSNDNDEDTLRRNYMPFDSACKIATEKNKIVESSHFWIGNKVSGFLLYFPEAGKYSLKTVNKNRKAVGVSEETYQDCLADVEDQRKQDRLYNWQPPTDDYYDIENWSFNIKDGKLIR